MAAIPFREITALLERWASNDIPIVNFTVNNVLAELGLSGVLHYDVLKYLSRMNGFELISKKMLLCPNGHKGRTFPLDTPIDEEQLFECWCSEQYYFDPDFAIIVFSFTEDFISQSREKKKSMCEFAYCCESNHRR